VVVGVVIGKENEGERNGKENEKIINNKIILKNDI
jgi:hypothetical protein